MARRHQIGLIVRRAAAPSEGRAVQKEPVEYGGTTREALKHGTPVRGKGRVDSAASLGGPDPRYAPPLPRRIARALLGFVFEEVSKN